MKTILILCITLLLLFIFSKNETFIDQNECSKIQEGECNSKLCPSNCKIQHSSKTDKCYCVERK
jgi:hypothetical protein